MNREQKPSSLWRNADYLLLWSGQVISATGTRVSQLAFPLLILAITHSPAQAGIIAALRALPYLIFSLPAGGLIDRWDRKCVMIVCDAGRALSLASIPVALALGHLTILQLYLILLIEGTLFVFFDIAEVACLPNIVSKEQLPAATAQNEMATAATSLVGPFLSGVLYSIERLLPFVADAISYAISVLSLAFIKVDFQQQREVAQRRLWIEVTEGLRWLWRHPLLRFMAILAGGSNLLSAGYVLLIVVLMQRWQASSLTIGLIFTIGGIGGILGALVAPSIQQRLSFGQVLLSAWWLWAGLTLAYVLAPTPLLVGVISFLLFLLVPICNTVLLSYRLALIPDALLGRVNSAFRLLAFSGQPLGLALTGWLIERVGVIPTILFMAAGLAFLALIGTLNTHVRHA